MNDTDPQATTPRCTGFVSLVGAGPGDPGLITVRGAAALRNADLVLYDGLVNPLLLAHARNAERTCRRNGPDGYVLDQPTINQRLIDEARAGKKVVRLKGGDPYIFGRGSEEADALANAGVPFEVVPGITAATAAAIYAGFSLTHRDFASAVAFVTGHEDPAKAETSLDYHALASFPGTLVFYMGLHRIGSIADALVAAGKPASTPVDVICRATTPFQQKATGTLADIASLVAGRKLHPPSLVIVGDVLKRTHDASWFENRPLLGIRIGIARDESQAEDVIARCLSLGAEPVPMPLITISPVPDSDLPEMDRTIRGLRRFDWLVFTSANGVTHFLDRCHFLGFDGRILGDIKIAVIGPATAAALENYFLKADLVPRVYRAEELARELSQHVAGKRVLWAKASRGRDVLPKDLANAGAIVEELVVYLNRDVEQIVAPACSLIEQGLLHWIALSSPSIARRLADLLPATASKSIRLASISPVTSEVARAAGLEIHAEATTYTWPGLLDAITAFELQHPT